jgi:hypothetical protein
MTAALGEARWWIRTPLAARRYDRRDRQGGGPKAERGQPGLLTAAVQFAETIEQNHALQMTGPLLVVWCTLSTRLLNWRPSSMTGCVKAGKLAPEPTEAENPFDDRFLAGAGEGEHVCESRL